MLSSASRGSIAFALTSCFLSALFAFYVSGAVAAAYTIAYSAIAALTIHALGPSRSRYSLFCAFGPQYSELVVSFNFPI
jgi:hypothetical protein